MIASRHANKKEQKKKRRPRCWVVAACIILLAVFCYSAYQLIDGLLRAKKEQDAFEALSALVEKREPERTMIQNETVVPGREEEIKEKPFHEDSVPVPSECPSERIPLQQYMPLYERNPDFFGWISIEGTEISYPVMYAPDRPDYYLDHAFDGSSSSSGVPFLDSDCSTEGNFFLIYGHHMKNKTMFGPLLQYADESYYEAHPVICFDTLYEQREYQVVAAFYSRVYDKNETGVFRYYEYTDLSDREEFEEYVNQVKAAAIYDTGVEVAYGDELLALSTCSYHTENGRFVVVARRRDNVE